MRIKAIYVKNLGMSGDKVASQVAHAVKNIGETPKDCAIIVLGVSRTKFYNTIEEIKALTPIPKYYIQKDQGKTEVKAGTETAMAWIESE